MTSPAPGQAAPLLRTLLPDLWPVAWRDVTAAMNEHGFPGSFIEVEHDAGHTILSVDEDGDASTYLGVEMDEEMAREVVRDMRGPRRYEMDLSVAEEMRRDSNLPRVA